MMSIVQVVVAMRCKLNKTQAGLAELMEVAPRTVTRLEAGEKPSLKVLSLLAEIAKKNSLHGYHRYFEGERDAIINKTTGTSDKIPPVSIEELTDWERKLSSDLQEIDSILDGQRRKLDSWAYQVMREHLAGIEDVRYRIQFYAEHTGQLTSPPVDPKLVVGLLASSQPKPTKRTLKKLGADYAKQVAAAGKKMRDMKKHRKPRKA